MRYLSNFVRPCVCRSPSRDASLQQSRPSGDTTITRRGQVAATAELNCREPRDSVHLHKFPAAVQQRCHTLCVCGQSHK